MAQTRKFLTFFLMAILAGMLSACGDNPAGAPGNVTLGDDDTADDDDDDSVDGEEAWVCVKFLRAQPVDWNEHGPVSIVLTPGGRLIVSSIETGDEVSGGPDLESEVCPNATYFGAGPVAPGGALIEYHYAPGGFVEKAHCVWLFGGDNLFFSYQDTVPVEGEVRFRARTLQFGREVVEGGGWVDVIEVELTAELVVMSAEGEPLPLTDMSGVEFYLEVVCADEFDLVGTTLTLTTDERVDEWPCRLYLRHLPTDSMDSVGLVANGGFFLPEPPCIVGGVEIPLR